MLQSNKKREKVIDFFEKAEKVGLLSEIESKLDAEADAQRARLVAALRALRENSEARTAPLSAARIAAEAKLKRARVELEEAERLQQRAAGEENGAANDERRKCADIERELNAIAPSFLRDYWHAAREIWTVVRHQVTVVPYLNVDFVWGQRDVRYITNAEVCAAACAQAVEVMNRLAEMTFDPRPAASLRKEADGLMARLLKSSHGIIDVRLFSRETQTALGAEKAA